MEEIKNVVGYMEEIKKLLENIEICIILCVVFIGLMLLLYWFKYLIEENR